MNMEENTLECDLCQKAFNKFSHLIAHKHIHSGERPYQCDICEKMFTKSDFVNP